MPTRGDCPHLTVMRNAAASDVPEHTENTASGRQCSVSQMQGAARSAAEQSPEAAAAAAAPAAAAALMSAAAGSVSDSSGAGPSAADAPAQQPAATLPDACSGARPASPPQDGSGAAAAGGRSWCLPNGVAFEDVAPVWVGAADAPGLQQLQLAHSRADWSVLDPGLLEHGAAGAGGP